MNDFEKLSEVVSLLRLNIQCSICLDQLSDPVSTWCNHHFCSSCYNQHIFVNRVAHCPMCQVRINRRSIMKNKLLEDLVRAVSGLVASVQLDTGIDFSEALPLPRSTLEASCPPQVKDAVTAKAKETVSQSEAKDAMTAKAKETGSGPEAKDAITVKAKEMVSGPEAKDAITVKAKETVSGPEAKDAITVKAKGKESVSWTVAKDVITAKAKGTISGPEAKDAMTAKVKGTVSGPEAKDVITAKAKGTVSGPEAKDAMTAKVKGTVSGPEAKDVITAKAKGTISGPEAKDAMTAKAKETVSGPEAKDVITAKAKGTVSGPEAKDAMTAKVKGTVSGPEARDVITAKAKGTISGPEAKDVITAKAKGTVSGPEAKDVITAKAKEIVSGPEAKDVITAKAKGTVSGPEAKDAMTAKAKETVSGPETKDAMTAKAKGTVSGPEAKDAMTAKAKGKESVSWTVAKDVITAKAKGTVSGPEAKDVITAKAKGTVSGPEAKDAMTAKAKETVSRTEAKDAMTAKAKETVSRTEAKDAMTAKAKECVGQLETNNNDADRSNSGAVVAKEKWKEKEDPIKAEWSRRYSKKYPGKRAVVNVDESFIFPAELVGSLEKQSKKKEKEAELDVSKLAPERKVQTWLERNKDNLENIQNVTMAEGSLCHANVTIVSECQSDEDDLLSVSQRNPKVTILDVPRTVHLSIRGNSNARPDRRQLPVVTEMLEATDTDKPTAEIDPYTFISSQKSQDLNRNNNNNCRKRKTKSKKKDEGSKEPLWKSVSLFIKESYRNKSKRQLGVTDASFLAPLNMNDTFDKLRVGNRTEKASGKGDKNVEDAGKERREEDPERPSAADDRGKEVPDIANKHDEVLIFCSQTEWDNSPDLTEVLSSGEEWEEPAKKRKPDKGIKKGKNNKDNPASGGVAKRQSRGTAATSTNKDEEMIARMNDTFKEIEDHNLMTGSQVEREAAQQKKDAESPQELAKKSPSPGWSRMAQLKKEFAGPKKPTMKALNISGVSGRKSVSFAAADKDNTGRTATGAGNVAAESEEAASSRSNDSGEDPPRHDEAARDKTVKRVENDEDVDHKTLENADKEVTNTREIRKVEVMETDREKWDMSASDSSKQEMEVGMEADEGNVSDGKFPPLGQLERKNSASSNSSVELLGYTPSVCNAPGASEIYRDIISFLEKEIVSKDESAKEEGVPSDGNARLQSCVPAVAPVGLRSVEIEMIPSSLDMNEEMVLLYKERTPALQEHRKLGQFVSFLKLGPVRPKQRARIVRFVMCGSLVPRKNRQQLTAPVVACSVSWSEDESQTVPLIGWKKGRDQSPAKRCCVESVSASVQTSQNQFQQTVHTQTSLSTTSVQVQTCCQLRSVAVQTAQGPRLTCQAVQTSQDGQQSVEIQTSPSLLKKPTADVTVQTTPQMADVQEIQPPGKEDKEKEWENNSLSPLEISNDMSSVTDVGNIPGFEAPHRATLKPAGASAVAMNSCTTTDDSRGGSTREERADGARGGPCKEEPAKADQNIPHKSRVSRQLQFAADDKVTPPPNPPKNYKRIRQVSSSDESTDDDCRKGKVVKKFGIEGITALKGQRSSGALGSEGNGTKAGPVPISQEPSSENFVPGTFESQCNYREEVNDEDLNSEELFMKIIENINEDLGIIKPPVQGKEPGDLQKEETARRVGGKQVEETSMADKDEEDVKSCVGGGNSPGTIVVSNDSLSEYEDILEATPKKDSSALRNLSAAGKDLTRRTVPEETVHAVQDRNIPQEKDKQDTVVQAKISPEPEAANTAGSLLRARADASVCQTSPLARKVVQGSAGGGGAGSPKASCKVSPRKLAPRANAGAQGVPGARCRLTFACSGLGPLIVQQVKKIAKSMGARFSDLFVPELTHLIVKVDENNSTDNTLKYLQAVAAGKWVVSFAWINACAQAKKLVPEESYEVVDAMGYNGPQRSRTRSAPIFKDFQFCCVPPFTIIPGEALQEMLTLCGATVVSSPKKLTSKENTSNVCLVEAVSPAMQDTYYRWLEQYGVVTVGTNWIVECIGSYAVFSFWPHVAFATSRERLLALGYSEELLQSEDEADEAVP